MSAVGALLLLAGCSHPTKEMKTGAGCGPISGGEVYLQGVGRTDGNGCEAVGGSLFTVTRAGLLEVSAEWYDPEARLHLEVWRGAFREQISDAAARASSTCIRLDTQVEPGDYVLRVCHAPDSRATGANPAEASTFTPYRLSVKVP